jgi:hypothetical protein
MITSGDIMSALEGVQRNASHRSIQKSVLGHVQAFDRAREGIAEDPIEYVEASWGLNIITRPIQSFLLKLVFGIKLDDRDHDQVVEVVDSQTIRVARPMIYRQGSVIEVAGERHAVEGAPDTVTSTIRLSKQTKAIEAGCPIRRRIAIYDRFREKLLGAFTESQFLEWLHSQQRCNMGLDDHNARLGKQVNTCSMRMGRRWGKSYTAVMVVGCKTYEALRWANPQRHYGIGQDQPIQITMVSTSEGKAQKLLRPIRSAIQRSPIFRELISSPPSKSSMILHTRYTKENGLSPDSGLSLWAAPCVAGSIRGDANLCVLLEEFGSFLAEMRHKRGSSKSDLAMFRAVEPSIQDFTDPITGHPLGLLCVISTPISKNTYMYELEQKIMGGEIESSLALHMPTVWGNPAYSTMALRNNFARDRLGHLQELEAEWLDEKTSGFDKASLERCRVDPGPTSLAKQPNEVAVMGIDLGMVTDGASIAVALVNPVGRCRIVHLDHFRMGDESSDSWRAFVDSESGSYLDIRLLAERIDEVWTQWGCVSGMTDQHNSHGLRALLRSSARRLVEFVEVGVAHNDRIARSFIGAVSQSKLIIYAEKDSWDDPVSFLNEIRSLDRITTGGSVTRIALRAPEGAHDDRYSAVSRAVWMAERRVTERPASTQERSGTAAMARAIRNRAEQRVRDQGRRDRLPVTQRLMRRGK